jgi:hypothetical protein
LLIGFNAVLPLLTELLNDLQGKCILKINEECKKKGTKVQLTKQQNTSTEQRVFLRAISLTNSDILTIEDIVDILISIRKML